MKRNLMVMGIVLILTFLAVYQNLDARSKNTVFTTEVAPKANFLAPAFILTAMNGQTYVVGGARDKPVLVNFWASWCGPCEAEAPDFEKLFGKYKGKFDLYGVNITNSDNLKDAEDMVKQYKLSFPILLDKEGKATALYQISLVPTSYLVDKSGTIVDVFHVLDYKELERKIKKLIEE